MMKMFRKNVNEIIKKIFMSEKIQSTENFRNYA